jgi:hypothetical protein
MCSLTLVCVSQHRWLDGIHLKKGEVLERSGRERSGNERSSDERSGDERSGRKSLDAKGPDSFFQLGGTTTINPTYPKIMSTLVKKLSLNGSHKAGCMPAIRLPIGYDDY